MADRKEDMAKQVPVRCQRIGCNAMFTEDNNPEDSCQYHPSGPIFHDGTKEWSCCKQRSHDFSLFLEIPGCEKGKHTSEKPVTKASVSTQKATTVRPSSQQAEDVSSLKQVPVSCSRCRQGFFCSDHGSQPRPSKPEIFGLQTQESDSPAPKKKIDLNEPQTCRNKGCGKTFKEKDNHETACEYHPGPPVFHDRKRGWKCCDIYVNEFDEFMNIAPCAKGWHNADVAQVSQPCRSFDEVE